MTELVTPDLRWYDDWVATLTDFGEEYPHGSGCPQDGQALDRSAFEEFVADKLRYADPTAELPNGWVSCDFLWIVDAGEMVGFLALRHRLTDFLLEEGGHIGYSVRPARRREGHASRSLALAVSRAAVLGLERVLVTCDEDNLGSRRTIESGGGELEDVRTGKRRYWISTVDGRVGDMIAR